jgi:hypothetical protein
VKERRGCETDGQWWLRNSTCRQLVPVWKRGVWLTLAVVGGLKNVLRKFEIAIFGREP